MALSWKLVIDTTNAPALADFWAAALEYEVEDPSALVEQLLAAGGIGTEAVVEHRGRKTRPAASAVAGGCCSKTCPRASQARTVCTSTSTVSPAASTSW